MGKKRKRKGYLGSRVRLKPSVPSVRESDADQWTIGEIQNRGLKRLESQITGDGYMYKKTDPSLRKLSEILLEFVGDALELEAPFAEQRQLLLYAVSVWNQGIMDSEPDRFRKKRIIAEAVATIQRDMQPKLYDVLLARKHRDYPNDRRFIRKIDVSTERGHLFVNVASIDLGDPKAE